MLIKPDQLRQAYLDFFSQNQHVIIPSVSLVPVNDPTTLFTGFGMQPLLPYFLGQPHPQGNRLVNSQKCFRSQDIEEVGDNRHTTFFEMLGNWSFGDYFKKEQLNWLFTFLTLVCQLDPSKLFVSVYGGNSQLNIPQDDEAIKIWQQLFAKHKLEAKVVKNAAQKGLQDGRIFYYGDQKNWWSRVGEPSLMPEGEPGGPDSEVFFDFGINLNLHQRSKYAKQPCHLNCDCGRFLEIGNSVFMTYIKTKEGFKELDKKNIDFGGGLERIAAAINNNPDVFTSPFFLPLIGYLEEKSGKNYGENEKITRVFRIIADHIKAAVMLVADGVVPSNKEQGYFLRRLLRRSMRQAKQINLKPGFMMGLVPVIVELYGHTYLHLQSQVNQIIKIFKKEEEKFNLTLEKGLIQFNKEVGPQLRVSIAFKLFESYGFPLEMSIEEAMDQGLRVEPHIVEKFLILKQSHAIESRKGAKDKFGL